MIGECLVNMREMLWTHANVEYMHIIWCLHEIARTYCEDMNIVWLSILMSWYQYVFNSNHFDESLLIYSGRFVLFGSISTVRCGSMIWINHSAEESQTSFARIWRKKMVLSRGNQLFLGIGPWNPWVRKECVSNYRTSQARIPKICHHLFQYNGHFQLNKWLPCYLSG